MGIYPRCLVVHIQHTIVVLWRFPLEIGMCQQRALPSAGTHDVPARLSII